MNNCARAKRVESVAGNYYSISRFQLDRLLGYINTTNFLTGHRTHQHISGHARLLVNVHTLFFHRIEISTVAMIGIMLGDFAIPNQVEVTIANTDPVQFIIL